MSAKLPVQEAKDRSVRELQMTRSQLIAEVWNELPKSRYLLGRRRVDRLVESALRRWPVPVLCQCNADETNVVGHHLAKSVEREERGQYGMGFFASIILAAIVSEIVKILIRRWLENRTEMLEAVQ